MKTTLLFLILFLTGLNLRAQTPGVPGTPADAPMAPTVPASPPDENAPAANEPTPYKFDFQGVDMNQVLDIYADMVGRTILRPAALSGPPIVLHTQSALTKAEAIEALQAVLALNGISIVNIGDKFMKVMPSADALTAGGANSSVDAANLPDLGSLVTHIVQLKYTKPSEMMPAIQPFAKLNSIIPLDSNGILIIRDYAENVKRMLEMIAQVDVSVPAEYISEVIPIKYALASDIASALNSLGGSGGNTVSIGSPSGGSTGGNGLRSVGASSTGGIGGGNGYQNGANGQTRPLGTPGSTPGGGGAAGGANGFQQRLQAIIQRASGAGGQDQIQIFGQAKIIADTRSNSLLIFATRTDMDAITNVIAKLDVLLSQVLIESVIMEVSLGKQLNVGVSAIQNQKAFSGSITNTFVGTGGFNNGQNFFDFVNNAIVNNGTNSALPGGLSYFGSIAGSDYDVAVQAAESDSSTTIIQKPRIQTFQAQEASFFVGQTVPYVTSTYNGGTTGIGSSFSQLSVGVSLDVTPFINPDGLVVMQIKEEIDDINGSTLIEGVGNVPNTDQRTLVSNVAVKDRDSIILGGAIRSEKDHSSSGVPLLQDIPLLGVLFSAKTSNKTRDELLVLMRPTVLRTPDMASQQAKVEENRLPGIALAESQDNRDEAKQVAVEKKLQQIQDEKDARDDAKAAAKAAKSGKTNSVPVPVIPDNASVPTVAPAISVPTTSATPGIPPTSTGNPAAGLY